jgi:hypothetical protein
MSSGIRSPYNRDCPDTNLARPKVEIPIRKRFPNRLSFGAHRAASIGAAIARVAPAPMGGETS